MSIVNEILEKKEDFFFIYEDEICFAMLHESPAIDGHTIVMPKKKFTIIEEMDDETLAHIFQIVNKISVTLFEKMNITGTNIILQNGTDAGQEISQVTINIIPRNNGDNLNFIWPTKQMSEDSFNMTRSMLIPFLNEQENTTVIQKSKKTNEKPRVQEKGEKEEKTEKPEIDYRFASLYRKP